jgi:hypothetical protein
MKKIVFIFLFTMISIFSFSQEEKLISDSCYVIKEKDTTWQTKCVQVQPSFPRGDNEMFKFLAKHIIYPQLPKEMGVQGKNFVTFVIDTSGLVTNIALYKGVVLNENTIQEKYLELSKEGAKQLDQESLRVIRSMPRWIPGKENGKPVKVRYIMPINYKLS